MWITKLGKPGIELGGEAEAVKARGATHGNINGNHRSS